MGGQAARAGRARKIVSALRHEQRVHAPDGLPHRRLRLWARRPRRAGLCAAQRLAKPGASRGMSRRALLLSLALHAVILVVVWGWVPQTAPHAGSGEAGAGTTFSAASAGGLLVETAPGSPAAPVVDVLPQPPNFALATLLIDPLPAPVEVLTTQMPALSSLSPKAVPVKASPAPGKGGSALKSNARNSGAGTEGAGFAAAAAAVVRATCRRVFACVTSRRIPRRPALSDSKEPSCASARTMPAVASPPAPAPDTISQN